jgi:hypothetical protein
MASTNCNRTKGTTDNPFGTGGIRGVSHMAGVFLWMDRHTLDGANLKHRRQDLCQIHVIDAPFLYIYHR